MYAQRQYSVLIIDDDASQIAHVKDLLENSALCQDLSCTTAHGAKKAQDIIAYKDPHSFDLVISDIDLGPDNPSGIELVKKYFAQNGRTQVIFLTGYLQFVSEVFETKHCYILTKPITLEGLEKAISTAIGALEKAQHNSGYLALNVQGGVRKILCSDVLWIESEQHKVMVYTKGGPLEASGPLSSFENLLPKSFYRIHRKYLINFEHLDYFGEKAHMDNGVSLPISRANRSEAKSAFLNYIQKSI